MGNTIKKLTKRKLGRSNNYNHNHNHNLNRRIENNLSPRTLESDYDVRYNRAVSLQRGLDRDESRYNDEIFTPKHSDLLDLQSKLFAVLSLWLNHRENPSKYLWRPLADIIKLQEEIEEKPVNEWDIPIKVRRHPDDNYAEIIRDLYLYQILTRRQAGLLTQVCTQPIPFGVTHHKGESIYSTIKFMIQATYATRLGENYSHWIGLVPIFEFIFNHEDILKQRVTWRDVPILKVYADNHTTLRESETTRNVPVDLVFEVLSYLPLTLSEVCNEDIPNCAICKEQMTCQHAKLPCGHTFHENCIRPWFKSKRKTCPLCRANVSSWIRDFMICD